MHNNMKHLKSFNESKPAGAPEFHDSKAPDAHGRFRDLSIKDLAAWLIKTRKKDVKKISSSLTQQIVFNRNDDPEYAEKMEKTRQEVYKQLGRTDLMDSKQIDNTMKYIKKLNETAPFGDHNKSTSDGMSYGQLERCMDYSKMIRERIEAGQSLDPWMHSQIAIAENELNSVFDALDADDGVVEAKAKPGPDAYETGLDDEEVEDKKDQMKKQAKMDDDDPAAYKEMPGDVEARESGKVKTSKHVKSYHELYGDDETNESVKTTSLKRYKELKKKGIAVELVTKADLNDKKNETLSESDRVYIDFLNKDKKFKQDRKYFKSWEEAVKWGRSEFDRFSSDMIKYESLQLTEGTMSDIHQLAGEVKSEDEFVKKFFKEYGAKIKKSSDSVEWVKSLYKDTVDESVVSENTMITATGVSGSEVKHLKTMSPYVKVQGPGVYITVNDDNKEEVLDYLAKIKAEVSESIINEDEEKKQSTDRTPLDDDAMETGLKKKAEETGVPIGIIRAVARRGLAAWKTGHRPGATQQQWAYSRVNSFLTKQPGTWGGADGDLAKEVRDGGHDKKLKKV